jgi:hypothetical protein
MNFVKRNWIPVLILVVMMTGLYFLNSAKILYETPASNPSSTVQTPDPAPTVIYQSPSAKNVADSLGCKRFEDHGPSQVGGSIDSGACWIGNVKYAVNTFLSKPSRDAWLTDAEPLGVVPKWETDTSVTYKSVD